MLRTKLRTTIGCLCTVLALYLGGCSKGAPAGAPEGGASEQKPRAAQRPSEPPEPELLKPVARWRDGERAGMVDARGDDALTHLFIDLGESWTPILFTDGVGPEGKPLPHKFRDTYLALARGEFPNDPYGERARDDKYLELYGILPTLGELRERMRWARGLTCGETLDLSPLVSFTGVVTYQSPGQSARAHRRYRQSAREVKRLMAAQKVDEPELLELERLRPKQQAAVRFYRQRHDEVMAIEAAQARLSCEGYFKGKGKWVKGAFDWATHEALAEFERRHHIYSWGAMGSSTVEALRESTLELERETVIRVLTERAMLALGAIEDGSATKSDGTPHTFRGADGRTHEVPNLEAEVRAAVVQGFGLQTPEATSAFLEGLGELDEDGHRFVAIPGPSRPEYYSEDMDLSVVIDRGDVWYEFPFDERGKARHQSVSRRPHTNLYVNYLGQRILIARLGTTIGGWKRELIDDDVWWKYKGSPTGEVVWQDIVSAPVWLPPSSTPPRALLTRRKRRKKSEPKWEPNYHETGPSYASAYGLVAAYHRQYRKDAEGVVHLGRDEGIRSHGSVDYMSIMRRHSHGCHRLHNQSAVRLFSFVVKHRPHVRTGHQPTAFIMDIEYEEEQHRIEIRRGGYAFRLEQPIFVNVEEGRIKGQVDKPIQAAIPKYNEACEAYYLPDGGAVVPQRDGTLVATTPTIACDDAGVPIPEDAGVESAPALADSLPTWGDSDLVNTLGLELGATDREDTP